jgi:folate-binding protein YgfZ
MTITAKNPLIEPINSSFGPAPLSDWGLIFVEGADAATFLQNQLTNSVLGLERSQPGEIAAGSSAVRLIGYCSPKGRLLASGWLGLFPQNEGADDRFAIFISKDIAASTAKRLSMFVLRSKVTISDVSDNWKISGFYGSDTDLYINSVGSLALRMPDVLVQGKSIARILMATPNTVECAKNQEALLQWNLLEVLSAIPRIVQATQEQFVPQMINFESVAGIDFKKGCYPGQEIVARSQYRGVIKRRLQLAVLKTNVADLSICKPGVELFYSDDASQPAGMVVLSARDPQEPDSIKLQIECKLEALEHGEIHLGSAAGPVLKMSVLPYQLLEI